VPGAQRDLLADIIKKDLEVPPFPAVAQAVIEAVNRPETTAETLSELITKDPGLTASVLKLVNSPFYGRRIAAKTVHQAVVYLGMKAVRWLMVSASAKMVYQRGDAKQAEAMWAHAVGAGLATRILSKGQGVNPEDAFVAGLLHDVGKTLMSNETPGQFEAAADLARSAGLPAHKAEQAIYGYSHADVGSLLIQRWNLPDNLDDAVRLHHDLELAAGEAPDAVTLVRIVNLADGICHRLGIGAAPAEELDLANERAVLELELDEDRLSAVIDEVRATWDKERSLFDG
jgi:HD-like signal output (HDOD) protein